METSPKIPVNLLRASRILMNEQPAGIRANMKDSLSSLSTRASKQPVERARVYLLLSFLHAVLQERLRYAPSLGWKALWEFNDSDVSTPFRSVQYRIVLTFNPQYECCSFIIDTWIDSVAHDRTNIAPKSIPWDIIRVLVCEMYGGKVDDAQDFETLFGMVYDIMTPAAFEDNYKIVKGAEGEDDGGGLVLPSGTTMKDFIDWVNGLPEREPPTYLGLPANAEKLLLVGQANEMMKKLSMVMNVLDEGEQVMAEAPTEG